MGSDTLEKLEQMVGDVYLSGDGEFIYEDVVEIVKKAYELGRKSVHKKVNDNPYHIDHKRQTKLEL